MRAPARIAVVSVAALLGALAVAGPVSGAPAKKHSAFKGCKPPKGSLGQTDESGNVVHFQVATIRERGAASCKQAKGVVTAYVVGEGCDPTCRIGRFNCTYSNRKAYSGYLCSRPKGRVAIRFALADTGE